MTLDEIAEQLGGPSKEESVQSTFSSQERPMAERKFYLGDLVKKKTGSNWHGKIVGFYSTEITPIGCCVESAFEKGSVQIYPEGALSSWKRGETDE